MELELHADAARELEAAYDWYLEHDEQVAEAFLEAVRAVVERAARFPRSGPPMPGLPADLQVRRFSVGDFPYSVIVAPAAGTKMAFAVAHDKRRPGYWRERLEP